MAAADSMPVIAEAYLWKRKHAARKRPTFHAGAVKKCLRRSHVLRGSLGMCAELDQRGVSGF